MVLCRILIIFVLLFSNIGTTQMNNNNILEITTTANEIIIYQDNSFKAADIQTEEYNKLIEEITKLSNECREAPAFGVSLHNETLEAMKSGTWIEFVFDETISHNDLPFNSLLINIVGEYTGFNIIRKYENKYDGRCFYVDLNNSNLSNLETIINNMF